ncbi:MAG TPA: hypothetical protein VHS74_17495 [Solirubrobacterales bacterium]|nr:hypothetical protein [Solirubrobacterales bacterium]
MLAVLLASAVLGYSLPSSAAAATGEPVPTVLPAAFKIHASNGYKAFVFAGAQKGGRGALSVEIFGHKGVAIYTVPAHVTETTIEASIGNLGEIDVHAVPAGHPIMESSKCSGGGKRFSVEVGYWEGTIRFRGEDGFTSFDATRATSTTQPFTRLVCGTPAIRSEGIGGHSPGALLTVKRRSGEERLELMVRKNKLAGPTRLQAQLSERRAGVLIDRSVNVVVSSKAFDFEIPPGLATVEPAAPFSGSLDFTRHGRSPSLKGDLTVDFPGRASVPVRGPGKVSAGLIRAVLNPSHPF